MPPFRPFQSRYVVLCYKADIEHSEADKHDFKLGPFNEFLDELKTRTPEEPVYNFGIKVSKQLVDVLNEFWDLQSVLYTRPLENWDSWSDVNRALARQSWAQHEMRISDLLRWVEYLKVKLVHDGHLSAASEAEREQDTTEFLGTRPRPPLQDRSAWTRFHQGLLVIRLHRELKDFYSTRFICFTDELPLTYLFAGAWQPVTESFPMESPQSLRIEELSHRTEDDALLIQSSPQGSTALPTHLTMPSNQLTIRRSRGKMQDLRIRFVKATCHVTATPPFSGTDTFVTCPILSRILK